MASLRRSKSFTPDGQTARFLYTILKQLDLKTIDWNQVAGSLDITNGHAARMRYSRFKQHIEGIRTQPRAPRVKKDKGRSGVGKSKGKREHEKEDIKREGGVIGHEDKRDERKVKIEDCETIFPKIKTEPGTDASDLPAFNIKPEPRSTPPAPEEAAAQSPYFPAPPSSFDFNQPSSTPFSATPAHSFASIDSPSSSAAQNTPPVPAPQTPLNAVSMADLRIRPNHAQSCQGYSPAPSPRFPQFYAPTPAYSQAPQHQQYPHTQAFQFAPPHLPFNSQPLLPRSFQSQGFNAMQLQQQTHIPTLPPQPQFVTLQRDSEHVGKINGEGRRF